MAAIVVNAGALSHSSWALHDALAAFDGVVVELHLSNPDAREPWRRRSVLAPVADGTVAGFGGLGYELAVEAAARLDRGARRRRPRTPSISAHVSVPRIVRLSPAWTSPAGCRGSPGVSPSSAATLCSSRSTTNIRYLTGFTGSAGCCWSSPTTLLLVTDGRYRDQAAEQVEAAGAAVRIEIGRPADQLSRDQAGWQKELRRLGLEAEDVTWGAQQRLARRLISPGTKLVSVSQRGRGAPRRQGRRRARPDRAGCGHRRRRPRAGEGAPVRGRRPSRSSRIALDFEMRRRGAECDRVRDDRRQRAEQRAARTLGRPSRRVEPGELVVIDFGATVDGYRSDMTRTVSVGAPASGELRELLEAVLAAQARRRAGGPAPA